MKHIQEFSHDAVRTAGNRSPGPVNCVGQPTGHRASRSEAWLPRLPPKRTPYGPTAEPVCGRGHRGHRFKTGPQAAGPAQGVTAARTERRGGSGLSRVNCGSLSREPPSAHFCLPLNVPFGDSGHRRSPGTPSHSPGHRTAIGSHSVLLPCWVWWAGLGGAGFGGSFAGRTLGTGCAPLPCFKCVVPSPSRGGWGAVRGRPAACPRSGRAVSSQPDNRPRSNSEDVTALEDPCASRRDRGCLQRLRPRTQTPEPTEGRAAPRPVSLARVCEAKFWRGRGSAHTPAAGGGEARGRNSPLLSAHGQGQGATRSRAAAGINRRK